ncbi:hypothetical protein [Catenulispora pinisilvae]|uniref:hypothetical protein n=1 Tax=Catenulispora pinisilvae TaxID=2705253 RepID=UPI0018918822|nr:hypothetical protein [Catenulispora pinisilvae]
MIGVTVRCGDVETSTQVETVAEARQFIDGAVAAYAASLADGQRVAFDAMTVHHLNLALGGVGFGPGTLSTVIGEGRTWEVDLDSVVARVRVSVRPD